MRFLPFLILFTSHLHAQSAFLKNADIVWAAEIEQDWVVDIPSLEMEWDSGVTTLKLLRTEENEPYWSSPYLADLVFQAAKDGHFPVFKDAQCRQQVEASSTFSSKDTIVTFDPSTYEEIVKVVDAEFYPSQYIKAWRLRQVLAYHQKTAQWSTTVEAIAPLIIVKNSDGDSIGLRPLFWFRPDDKKQKISSNHIVWAKKMVNRQQRSRVPTDGLHMVKIMDGFQNPMTHQFQVLAANPKIPFYRSGNDQLLTPEERISMISKTDTVVTFDPETYEEKVQVVHNDLDAAQIRQLRLVQTWYWDERKHRLSICLNAVAPLLDVLDNDGNYRFTRPLYYRRSGRK